MDYLKLNDDNILEVVPESSRDEQLSFIDAFRQAQADNTQQIGTAAHDLGSDLTAPYGGLHGPSEYMKSRYQTPQTESRLATLRTAAQLSALNQLMKNDLARYQEQATQAGRKALSAANSKSGNIVVDETPSYTTQGTLGVTTDEYKESAPYGITRTYNQGSFGGKPLYTDTANDKNGNPTGMVLNDNGSFVITEEMTNKNAKGPLDFLWNNPVINFLLGQEAY